MLELTKIVLTTSDLYLIDRAGLLNEFVQSFINENCSFDHVSYWICQNPSFPKMKSFLELEEDTLKLITYNRFSFNANFPTDINLLKKLNERNLICRRDVERNVHIDKENKEKILEIL